MQYHDGVCFVQNHEKTVQGCSRLARQYALDFTLLPKLGKPIMSLKFTTIQHSLYSTPSDFHFFELPKGALRGRPLSAEDEMKETVHDWLGTFSPVSFSDGIIKPVGL